MKQGQTAASGTGASGATVRALPFVGDDAALVLAMRGGHPSAAAAMFDRHGVHVRRVLVRLLGHDGETLDRVHDVFVRALDGIGSLSDPSALKAWLTRIAVFTAREHIRKKVRRRWLWFVDDVPEVEAPSPTPEVNEALRATYAVLGKMPEDERIPFALRFLDGMELTEVADACDVSLATVKRRLSRAETRFVEEAARQPVLREWLEGGTRWSSH